MSSSTRKRSIQVTCPNCGLKQTVKVAKGDKAQFYCDKGCKSIFDISPDGIITKSYIQQNFSFTTEPGHLDAKPTLSSSRRDIQLFNRVE